MRLSKEFDTETLAAERARASAEKLLDLLKQHHDFSVPKPPVKEVIEIRCVAEPALPVEICILPIPEGRLTVEAIKRVVCKHFGISHNDIISARRDRKVQRPRMVAMFLAKEFTNKSLPELGRRFGFRDHTTILNSVRRAAELIANNDPISNDISYLREVLSA